ncbi:DUF6795 domain-containing protein [Vibrio rotiferianus]|uniref:DUF6795 domain-containing protein n=1 Tax=Vibrio rotiferianus TaxID=190895 RepID=UPI00148C3A51|nr:DUF6795 domain-containing protein [Vibrio rotiferianus]NOH67726.1 DUF4198 domain-containing protein [Vibrio rotiferianus]
MKKIILFKFVFFIMLIMSVSFMFDFFKPYKLKISPEVNGVIKKQGEPVKNMEVTLLAGLNDYKEVMAFTDRDGRFHFDELIQGLWFKPSALNTNVIGIQITAKFNNHDVLLWSSDSGLSIHDYITNNLKSLECDIESQESEYHFKNRVVEKGADHLVFGVCKLSGFDRKYQEEE